MDARQEVVQEDRILSAHTSASRRNYVWAIVLYVSCTGPLPSGDCNSAEVDIDVLFVTQAAQIHFVKSFANFLSR